MAWRLRAKYYEACNCAYGCPCNMNGFPTHGFCEGTVAFDIVEGDKDGVDLAGAKAAGAVKWPGAIHEGNGVAAIFIDGNERQGDALVAILTAGDPGLPWEILATTISEIHGPFFERIEITDDGTDSHLSVGASLRSRWRASRTRSLATSTKRTWCSRTGSSSRTGRSGRPR